MKIFVFDTNTIILFLKDDSDIVPLFNKAKELKILPVISIITKIELLGFSKITKQEEEIIINLLEELQIENLSNDIVDQAIKLRRKYKLKIPDAIIAATAIVNKATLVTRDIEHFERIKGLKIADPSLKESNILS